MDAYDYKVTKRNQPTTNDKSSLEIKFEKDYNLFLLKNKILIKGAIKVHKDFVVENGFVAKLFDTLTVEVNSVAVSYYKSAGDYWLADYIYKYGNYNKEALQSSLQTEGYFDMWNTGFADMSDIDIKYYAARQIQLPIAEDGKEYIKYFFAFTPNFGFLRDSQPLMKGADLKLKFDRAKSSVAFLNKVASTTETLPNYIEITDCSVQTEWVSSPELRAHFAKIDTSPLKYDFDECQVYLRNLEKNQKTVRINQIRSGNLPSHMFVGIIESPALDGSLELSSTGFQCNNVERFNITLDGSCVNGYPISVESESPVYPLLKFNDTVARLSNISAAGGFSQYEFSYNFLWSHHFEAETTSTGWINIELDFKSELNRAYTMVIWCITPYSLLIDKFYQFERLRR